MSSNKMLAKFLVPLDGTDIIMIPQIISNPPIDLRYHFEGTYKKNNIFRENCEIVNIFRSMISMKYCKNKSLNYKLKNAQILFRNQKVNAR